MTCRRSSLWMHAWKAFTRCMRTRSRCTELLVSSIRIERFDCMFLHAAPLNAYGCTHACMLHVTHRMYALMRRIRMRATSTAFICMLHVPHTHVYHMSSHTYACTCTAYLLCLLHVSQNAYIYFPGSRPHSQGSSAWPLGPQSTGPVSLKSSPRGASNVILLTRALCFLHKLTPLINFF